MPEAPKGNEDERCNLEWTIHDWWCIRNRPSLHVLGWTVLPLMTDYDSILEVYTLPELIELNDLSEAEVLEVLVEAGVVDLPEILPLEFDDKASK